jgi:hypothetical protein
MDFTVNGVESGTRESEIKLAQPGRAQVVVRAAANLDLQPDPAIRKLNPDDRPYWALERARIGTSRTVPVQLVVNGAVAATETLLADGTIRTLRFDIPLERSSWIAVRILPSSHTNPVFAIVGGEPIRASRRSAAWCLDAVNQCWTQKAAQIRPAEIAAARQAYDHARQVYRQRLAESKQ